MGEIDIEKLQAEIAKLTPEQRTAELLKIRTRQKTQQLSQTGQKEYQKRQREKFKLLKEQAIRNGTWDGIEQQALLAAKQKVSAA